jgi:hypothetical protein
MALMLGVPASAVFGMEKWSGGGGCHYRLMKALMEACGLDEREAMELAEGRMPVERVIEIAKQPPPAPRPPWVSAKRQTRKQRLNPVKPG